MYFWLGLSFSLAGVLVLNALASVAAAGVWRFIAPVAAGWRAQDRARFLFALRLAPVIAATLFVSVFLIPTYLTHEPPHTSEPIGWLVGVFAVLSVFGFALASWRGVAALFVTRRLVKSWLRESVPVKLDGIEIPSFSVRHPFPLVAVVGIYRPRLFIAEHLLNTLTPGELDAALRHELGHLATGDNLKRFALRACSDALSIFPCGRSLDKAWAESAECAADEHAAGNQPEVSLELASALVKIARLAASAGRFSTPVGAYLFGPEEDAGFLAQRVRNLASPVTERSRLRPDYAVWSGLASLLCLLVFAVSQTSVTSAFHSMLEHLAAF